MKFIGIALALCLNLAFASEKESNLKSAFFATGSKNFNQVKAYSQKIGSKEYEIYLFSRRVFSLDRPENSVQNCLVAFSSGEKIGAFCLDNLKHWSDFELITEEHDNLLLYTNAAINGEMANFSFEFTPKNTGFALQNIGIFKSGSNGEIVSASNDISLDEFDSWRLADLLAQNLSDSEINGLIETKISVISPKFDASINSNTIEIQALNKTENAFKNFDFEGAFNTYFDFEGENYMLTQLYKNRPSAPQNGTIQLVTQVCEAVFKSGELVGKLCYDASAQMCFDKRPAAIAVKDEFFTIEDSCKFEEGAQTSYVTFRATQGKFYLHKYGVVRTSAEGEKTQMHYSASGKRLYLQSGSTLNLNKLRAKN